jgi:CSLREA domain-containing protein
MMLHPRQIKQRLWGMCGAVLAIAAVLALSVSVRTAQAETSIYVTTTAPGVNDDGECSLQEAIYAANLDASTAPDPAHLADPNAFIATACAAGSGPDTIWLPAKAAFTMSGPAADVDNYLGPTATPMVTSTITIEAAGSRIQHGGGPVPYRAFAVGAGGNLTLHEIHVKGFEVHGGNGATGGAGGLGAGGAIYVQHGRLGVGWSTFEQNGALGGNGSTGQVDVGGGGGGLGGNGGKAFNEVYVGGGGGGGARGNGGAGDSYDFAGGAGGGGGGTVRDGESGDDNPDTGSGELAGGLRCGAAGGYTDAGFGSDDGDDAALGCPGGGGGGGESFRPRIGLIGNGEGGNGSYGGGGGGGGYDAGGGGNGGFGGGGGGGATCCSQLEGLGPDGGDGGFGAGGGSGHGGYISGGPGSGGTFGGDGDTEHGGGGGGLGGAIFGHQATIEVRNSTFAGNYARRGHSGGGDANDGRASGGAIFLVAGSLEINNATFNSNLTDGVGDLGGGGIAVYKPTTGEATSLTLRNSILAGNGAHECFVRGGAGYLGSNNLIVDSTQNGHGDAPCSGVTVTDDPGLGPLTITAPGKTPTMKIVITSPAADAADLVTAEPDDQRGVPRPVGAGADIGAYEASDEAPTTTITLTPASPDGSNGWYMSTVGVTVSATDADGTVAQTRCVLDPASVLSGFSDLPNGACSLTNVGTDGQHTIYAASIDTNDNGESPPVSTSFKLDRTPPSLAPTLSTTTVVAGQTGVTASSNATDATSGVASSSCDAVDTSTPGVHTLNCTATDNAGNIGTTTLTYVVEYRVLGFFSPVPRSKWKLGQAVPIKIALADRAGTRIPDASAAAMASACRVKFSATGAQSQSATCMKYDPLMDQFVYTWNLAKKSTGTATITVTISYPVTTTTTKLSEQITITS